MSNETVATVATATNTTQTAELAYNMASPSSGLRFVIASLDTLPVLRLTVSNLVSDPTGSSVVFSMKNADTGVVTVSRASAQIGSITSASSLYTCILSYTFSAVTSATPGIYEAEFEVTLPGGGIITIPNDPKYPITVVIKNDIA
ncbi:MAG: hypothetical protein [Siphoviridae sp. ctvD11]|nr:MAG: hypothetical protein [Siphoviridae sp. ctvD11]